MSTYETALDYDPTPQLLKCKTLKSLNLDELHELIEIGRVEVFKKGQAVFRKGKAVSNYDNGRTFYIVLEGKLLLRLKNKRTKEYTRGHLFGEVAFLGEVNRSGTVRAIEDSVLIAFDKDLLLSSGKISTALALKVVLLLSKEIVSYFEQEMRHDIQEVISRGESDSVEFKKSISKGQKIAVVKSLVAFMNLNGGTVLCGISDDDGKILGINASLKQIDDFQKGVQTEARKRIGFPIDNHIIFTIVKINDKKILRIDCESAASPVYYKELEKVKNSKQKKTSENFIVRSGSENIKIVKPKDVINYVRDRFKK